MNFPVEIVLGDLIRDTDNVAMSSRNRYLSEDERTRARSISQAVFAAEAKLAAEGFKAASEVIAEAQKRISEAGGVVDYVEIRDADNLEEPTEKSRELLFAVAAFFGTTRLIDNCFVKVL